MFTGIITEQGKILKIERKKNFQTFTIAAKHVQKGKKVGSSIAVNGVCLTITSLQPESFSVDLVSENLRLTNLGTINKSDRVNLEAALKIGQTIDGHLVQGHVDGMGTVVSLTNSILKIKYPESLAPFITYKGSITINGVSLTITSEKNNHFEVALIPETLKKTNLKNLTKNDKVNLEVDLIARYLWKQMKSRNQK